MKPEAVHQAYERFERASVAAVHLADADRPLGQPSIDWSNFVMVTNTVYTKLEQGSKGNKTREYWYSTKKHIRKKDPLLRYLHVARNSDEHSLELVSGIGMSGRSFHEGVTVAIDESRRNIKINFEDFPKPEPGAKVAELMIAFYPQTATDQRFNDRFDPPGSNLGQPVADQTASGIVALALDYLEKMIAEARALLSARIMPTPAQSG
jgi:hypothetical protein